MRYLNFLFLTDFIHPVNKPSEISLEWCHSYLFLTYLTFSLIFYLIFCNKFPNWYGTSNTIISVYFWNDHKIIFLIWNPIVSLLILYLNTFDTHYSYGPLSTDIPPLQPHSTFPLPVKMLCFYTVVWLYTMVLDVKNSLSLLLCLDSYHSSLKSHLRYYTFSLKYFLAIPSTMFIYNF